ncbi:hypothetical protein J2Z33_002544 [Rubellimicrobium aerolatum]|nr:hypothetical protein [Rubellimicrobium aerolatum]
MAKAELQAWLLPVALATTSGVDLARLLLDEFRSRRVIVPGITLVERMVAQALLEAERHVADLLTRRLTAGQRDRLSILRATELDPALASAVHPQRLRRLCQEGARLTAQHLTTLLPTRRRAVLVATVLEAQVTLTDDAVLMFERLFGWMFRRVERGEEAALKRDRRTINDKIRLFARLGDALRAACDSGADAFAAIERVGAWDELGTQVDEAKRLVRPDPLDPVALVQSSFPILRQIGPAFVQAFAFGAVPGCSGLARGVEVMRRLGQGRLRRLPADAPTGFIRPTWRRRIGRDGMDRRIYEFCVLAELRDRLRAGDMWVEGSRRYCSVEQQLISAPVFAAMREAGPLPVPVVGSAAEWLADRRARLARRLAEVAAKAEACTLEEVQLKAGRLRISPLKSATPEEAEGALAPLYAHLPLIRVTDLLAEVDRWTGLAGCFTHLTTGRAHDEPRAVLTAVLADATNLGHARMAEACNLVSQRQLGWLSFWHLREDTYGAALVRLVDAQYRMSLAAAFGSGTASSSDGQHFPLDRRAQATGAVNPHKGSEPAVSSHTHLSNRYAPFHSKMISASAGEAAHVLDGLLHHSADLNVERQPHRRRRRVGPRVRALPSARVPVRAARPEPGRPTAAPVRGAGARARHRPAFGRPHRRAPGHGPLDRRAPAGSLDPHGRDQSLRDAGAARLLPARERAGARSARDRARRAHAVHARLDRGPRGAAPRDPRDEQGRSRERAQAGHLLPPGGPAARPRPPGPGPPRERAQPRGGRDRALEHDLPRSRHTPPGAPGTAGAARPAPAPVPARLAAHQPHRRLPLDRPSHPGRTAPAPPPVAHPAKAAWP